MGLELLGEETDPERRARLLDSGRRDVRDLDTIIEEVLVMARADGRLPARPFERVDLRALLESEAARTGATVGGDPADAMVAGDPAMLRHLVRNLLENAHRHAGGQEVRARLSATADAVTIAVEDRGPGVPEAERERIFAPFYQLPGAAPGGMGLGLALVQQVAHYHRGRAQVRPRDGGGSRFEVVLPRDHPPESPEPGRERRRGPISPTK
jgi:signal transduction histidine kinase